MPRARLVYDGDWVYTEKESRTHKLTQETETKIDNIPGVVDDVNSDSTTDALSAHMGKVLQNQINYLAGVGTFLSNWDCTTGLPETNPQTDPYYYKAWNYYIVGKIASQGGTNLKPHWAVFNQWVASTTVESWTIKMNDWYIYDGSQWIIQPAWDRTIVIDDALSPTSTNAVENRAVYSALTTKQDNILDLSTIRSNAALGATALQPWANITQLTNNAGYQTAWDVAQAIETLAPQWVGQWILTLQKNSTTIDTFSANATQNKTINITVPTAVSDLSDASDYATKTYVSTAIDEVSHSWGTAPSDPSAGTLWYDTTNNLLKVYDWTNWIVVWKTYTAWTNISIDANNQISATDTTYTAWTWLSLSSWAFSIDDDVVATKTYVTNAIDEVSHSWSTAPSNPSAWATWYDTTNNVLKVWNWTSWVALQELLVSWTNIKTINWQSVLWSGDLQTWEITFVTAQEYALLPASKETDWKVYFIYE